MTKLIVFDLDGTMYDINDVVQMSYDIQLDYLSFKRSISKKAAISFLAENHVYSVMKKDSRSATELFLQLGFDKEEWSRYRDANFDINKINKENSVDENIIRSFANLAQIVLLSSNAYTVIEKILSHIGISPSLFDTIICSDRFPCNEPFNKKRAMQFLSYKYSIRYSDMISIGDRYSTDILPMLELGGKGIELKQPQNLGRVLQDLKNRRMQTCPQYHYFVSIDETY